MYKKSLKFKQFQQLSLYLESQQTSKNMIIPIKRQDNQKWLCKLQQRSNVTVILGYKQPNGNKSIENILLNIVKFIPRYFQIQSRPSKNYSILYINTLASGNAYNDFKSIIEFLPIQYLRYLDKIFVLQANFKNKASYWWSFDYMTNFIKNKTIHYETLKEIVDRIKININKILDILPSQIVKALSQKQESVRIYLQNKENQIIYNPNVYNAQKQTYLSKTKPKLLLANQELGQTGAPLTIQLLISYFNGKQELLNTQGLFRKSVSIEEQVQLLKELSKGNYNCIEQVKDPHLIANAIKRFLSNLDEPIIPFNEFSLLMSINQLEFKENILKIIGRLGNNRKITLLLLVDFFKEKLLPRTAYNKMTQNNLSIVFAPCLMRSQVASINDLINTKKSITIALIILKDCDSIFGNKKQRLKSIRKSIQAQQRQSFLQRLKDTEFDNIVKLQMEQQNFEQKLQQIKQVKVESNQIQDKATNAQTNSPNDILNGIFQMIKQQMNQPGQDQFQQPFLIEQLQIAFNEKV